jgi:hypothetical protein
MLHIWLFKLEEKLSFATSCLQLKLSFVIVIVANDITNDMFSSQTTFLVAKNNFCTNVI